LRIYTGRRRKSARRTSTLTESTTPIAGGGVDQRPEVNSVWAQLSISKPRQRYSSLTISFLRGPCSYYPFSSLTRNRPGVQHGVPSVRFDCLFGLGTTPMYARCSGRRAGLALHLHDQEHTQSPRRRMLCTYGAARRRFFLRPASRQSGSSYRTAAGPTSGTFADASSDLRPGAGWRAPRSADWPCVSEIYSCADLYANDGLRTLSFRACRQPNDPAQRSDRVGKRITTNLGLRRHGSWF